MDKFFLILYLSICNVVWFYNYTLGNIKIVLVFLLILFNIKNFFNPRNYIYFPLFVCLIVSVLISLYFHGPARDSLFIIYGFVENYIFLVLGYSYAQKELIDSKFAKNITTIIIFLSLIIICNFFTGNPSWYSPEAILHYDELLSLGISSETIAPLYSTGFGIARTGWANSLCQFVPLVLMWSSFNLIGKTKKAISLIILVFCIFISQSRGGMLSATIMLSIYFYHLTYGKIKRGIVIAITLLIIIVVSYYWDSISILLRMADTDDYTTGRYEQYLYIPYLLQRMDWAGLGFGNISVIFDYLGLESTLHNTYIRLCLELGYCFTVVFICYVFIVLKNVYRSFRQGILNSKIASLIIIGGLVSGLLEPQAVWGTVSWYSIWWFFLGYIVFNNKSQHIIS